MYSGQIETKNKETRIKEEKSGKMERKRAINPCECHRMANDRRDWLMRLSVVMGYEHSMAL